MHKMTKACQISDKVKKIVYERDGGCCILCGSPYGSPDAHYIARSHGGLGIEENIVTLCHKCHRRYDNSDDRNILKEDIAEYLKSHYLDWDEDNLIYRKYGG